MIHSVECPICGQPVAVEKNVTFAAHFCGDGIACGAHAIDCGPFCPACRPSHAHE